MKHELEQARRARRARTALASLPSRGVVFATMVTVTVFLWAALKPGQAAQTATQPRQIVTIRQMRFEPQQVTVGTGDTVEWKNQDIFAHTVTADDGSFDSGLIQPGHSWSMSIKQSGTIRYHCRPHPNMTASLVVQAVADHQNAKATLVQGPERSATLAWKLPAKPEEFHPILVNFTAALLPLAFLSDVLGRLFRRPPLHAAASWMLLYEAVITPFTAAAGWWWKRTASSELPANVITVHQWLGTSAAVLFVLLAAWRWRFYRRDLPPSVAYLACALIAILALVYQGNLGGSMVFGL